MAQSLKRLRKAHSTELRCHNAAQHQCLYCCLQESEQTAAGGYKAAKALQQREEAGNRAAWNALFMRQDTVAQAIAAHYKVSKAELLDKDAAGPGPSFYKARTLRSTVRLNLSVQAVEQQ